jgi:hypothetical protein
VEAAILGAALEANGSLTPYAGQLIEHAPETFDDGRHGMVAVTIRDLGRDGLKADAATVASKLRFEGATAFVMGIVNGALPPDLAEVEAERAWRRYQQRRAKSVLGDALQAIESAPSQTPAIIRTAVNALDSLAAEATQGGMIQLLEERAFNPNIEPPPLRPIYTLAGIPVSTPANLTTITSAIKTGKSAVIGAMAAAAMPHGKDADLLGFSSSNPEGKALLWFDSEQSPDDFWHCVYRAMRRAGLAKPPPWLHAYCLTGLGCKGTWEFIQEATRTGAEQHGGIHASLIDGYADLVADVNDPAESNTFVAELHDMAIKHDCPIIGVIHFNPGTEKSRGHLGSQVERKAETNLALEKDTDETTVIYSTKNRRAGIPKSQGPRFRFSVEAGMHITVESRESAKDAERRNALLELALDVFGGHPAMRYSDIKSTVMTVTHCKERAAEKKIAEMIRLTVIKRSVAGMYEICTPA